MLLPLLESYNALGRPSFELIKSKEELESAIKKYRGILVPEVTEYLDSLVNLEFSVLRNDIISEQDRYALSQLDIYKSLAQYNVYHRAINIFKNQKDVQLFTNDNSRSGVEADALFGKSQEIMYVFNHNDKTSDYGSIKIARIKENDGQRENEINALKRELSHTSFDVKIPSIDYNGEAKVGGNSMEYFEFKNKVRALKKRIEELENASSLSADDKRIMELTDYFHDLILDDYGIELNDDEMKEKSSHTTQKQKVLAPHFDVYRYTLYK